MTDRIMNAVRPLSLLGLGLGAALWSAACGDDDAENVQAPSPTITFTDATDDQCLDGGQVITVGFDTDGDGSLAEAEISSQSVVCAGAAGEPGDPGEVGQGVLVDTADEAPGQNCTEGGIRIDVGLDADGDGTLAAGEISSTTYACNGAEGEPGRRSLVNTSAEGGVTCPDDGIVIEFGLDLDGSGTLEAGEVTSTETLCNGEIGGEDALITVDAEPPGLNCAIGGVFVQSGIDADGSGTLDAIEVEQSAYVCDAVQTLVRVSPEVAGVSVDCPTGGVRIESGPDADDDGVLAAGEVVSTSFTCSGADGQRTLAITTPEPPGANCAAGGTAIATGLDTSGDNVLDPGEVTATNYACNGPDGAGSSASAVNAVNIAAEPPGANCDQGGVVIETGIDTDGSGVLDPGEVTSTTYACNGASGAAPALINVVNEPIGVNCADGGQRIDVGSDNNGNGTLEAGEVTGTQYVCDVAGNTPPFGFVTAPTLNRAFLNVPAAIDIEAVGGTNGSYTWIVSSGSLPAGLTLGPTGTPSTTITGTPTAGGVFNFEITVTDFFGATAVQSFTLEVAPPPCAPGVDGAVGETETTVTLAAGQPSFGSGIRGITADSSPNGWIYYIDDVSDLQIGRVRKDGSVHEEDILGAVLVSADYGQEIQMYGNSIYATADRTTNCVNDCVYRISDDGGASFVYQDVGTFTGGLNDDVRGIHVSGSTMYMITHDPTETQLWSLDITAALPAPATLLGTYPDLEYCSGLDGDSQFLYTMCVDITGNSDQGVARISITGLTAESVSLIPDSSLDHATGSYAGVAGQDLDSDNLYDILFISGDSGTNEYVCEPSAPTVNGAQFSAVFLSAYADDDEGLGFDRTNNIVYKIDESASAFSSFQ